MKQTIKSILAFVAILLCGGAWAAELTYTLEADATSATLSVAFPTIAEGDTLTINANNTNEVAFDLDATVTTATLKIVGSGAIKFTRSSEATVTITDLNLESSVGEITFKDYIPTITSISPKNVAYNASTIGSYPYGITDGSQVTIDISTDASISTVFCPSGKSSRVMRLKKKGSGELTLSGLSYNKGIWTVEEGGLKQGVSKSGTGSAAYPGAFGRMSTGINGTGGEGGAGKAQNAYVDVKDGAYVDLNGKNSIYSYRLSGDGKGQGALVNTAAGLSETSEVALSIELAANASVGGDYLTGIRSCGEWANSEDKGHNLILNSYTLTKKGKGVFNLVNTFVNGGYLNIEDNSTVRYYCTGDRTTAFGLKGSGKFLKAGGNKLSFQNPSTADTGYAIEGSTIQIDAGTFELNARGGSKDARVKDPTFIIGADGALTAYGWMYTDGVVTFENNSDKTVFGGQKIRQTSSSSPLTKIVKRGRGNLTLDTRYDGDFAASVGFEIEDGVLTLAHSNNTTAESFSINGVISGAGAFALNKSTSTVTLAGANTLTGGVKVLAGTLKAGATPTEAAGPFGPEASTITVASGATLNFNGYRFADGGHGYTIKSAGTIKNERDNIDANKSLIKHLILSGDTTASGSYFGVTSGNNDQNKIEMNGHTLTVNMDSGNNFNLRNTTITGGGTINVTQGRLLVYQAAVTYDGTLALTGSNSKLELNSATSSLTVANFINSSGATIESTGKLIVNGQLSGKGSYPSLELAENAVVAPTTAITVSSTIEATSFTIDASHATLTENNGSYKATLMTLPAGRAEALKDSVTLRYSLGDAELSVEGNSLVMTTSARATEVTDDATWATAVETIGANTIITLGGDIATGTATIAAGNKLTVDLSSNTISGGTLTVNGTLEFYVPFGQARTIGATLTGSGSVHKTGGGTITFSGNNNDLTGGMYIDGGIGKVTHAAGFGRTNVSVAKGATVDLGGTDGHCYQIFSAGGTITNTGVAISEDHKQLAGVTLTGDTRVTGTQSYGILNDAYGESILALGEHKLIVDMPSDKTFFICNTKTTGSGSIDVVSGTLATTQSKPIGTHTGASAVDVVVRDGATLELRNTNNNVKFKTITLDSGSILKGDRLGALTVDSITGTGLIDCTSSTPSTSLSNAMKNTAGWTGKVYLYKKLTGSFDGTTGKPTNTSKFDGPLYGNSGSVVISTGNVVWLNPLDSDFGPKIELIDEVNGGVVTPALYVGDSSQNRWYGLNLVGGGTLRVWSKAGTNARILVKSADDFYGNVDVTNLRVYFGTTGTNANDGKIIVNSGATATIGTGKYWKAEGGVEVAGTVVGSGTITGNLVLTDAAASVTVASVTGTITKTVGGMEIKTVENDDGTHTYSLYTPVATIVSGETTKNFATIAEAIAEASKTASEQAPVAITLLAEIADAVNIPAHVVVDTASFTVTGKITGEGTIIFTGKLPGAGVPRSGLTNSSEWTGIVHIKNFTWTSFNFADIGNAESTVRVTGVSGYSGPNNQHVNHFAGTIDLVDDGATKALTFSNTYDSTYWFGHLTGTGTITTSGNYGGPGRYAFKDTTGFEGTIAIAHTGYSVTLGDVQSASDYAGVGSKGLLKVLAEAVVTLPSDKTWTARDGITIDGTIKGSGKLGSAATFGNTATIDLSFGIPSMANSATINLGEQINLANLGDENTVILKDVMTAPSLYTTVTVDGAEASGKLRYDSENHTIYFEAITPVTYWTPNAAKVDSDGILDWTATDAWLAADGVTPTTWPDELGEGETVWPSVKIDASVINGVKITGLVSANEVIVNGSPATEETTFNFHNSTKDVDGVHELTGGETHDKLTASSISLLNFSGKLGLKVPIDGEIQFSNGTSLIFLAGTDAKPSSAYGYTIVGHIESIGVTLADGVSSGRFIVPGDMYNTPFAPDANVAVVYNVADKEVTGKITGNGKILIADNTVSLRNVIACEGGLIVESGKAVVVDQGDLNKNVFAKPLVVAADAELEIAQGDWFAYWGAYAIAVSGKITTTARQSISSSCTLTLNDGAIIDGTSTSSQGDWEYHEGAAGVGKLALAENATATIKRLGIRGSNTVTVSGNNSMLILSAGIYGSGKIVLTEGITVKVASGTTASFADPAAGKCIKATLNQDGSTSYMLVDAVAKIGDVSYPSIAAAMDDAEDGDTIELVANETAALTLTKNITIDVASDRTITGTITGAYSITKTGSGALTLSAENTFTGGLNVNAGTVKAGHDNALGLGQITVEEGAVVSTATFTMSEGDGGGYDIKLNGGSINNTTTGASANSKVIRKLTIPADKTGYVIGDVTGVGANGAATALELEGNLNVTMSGQDTNFYLRNTTVSGSGTLTMVRGNLLIYSTACTMANASVVIEANAKIELGHDLKVKNIKFAGGTISCGNYRLTVYGTLSKATDVTASIKYLTLGNEAHVDLANGGYSTADGNSPFNSNWKFWFDNIPAGGAMAFDCSAVPSPMPGAIGIQGESDNGYCYTKTVDGRVQVWVAASSQPIVTPEDATEPTEITNVGTGITIAPNAYIKVPAGTSQDKIAVKFTANVTTTDLKGGNYVTVEVDDNGLVTVTPTDNAKPAATAITMATPTVETQDKVQFTITNPIPGLFYAVSSCDTPDGTFVTPQGIVGDQATTSAEAKTVSIPMTFTDGKKVKYYKVSVKATK